MTPDYTKAPYVDADGNLTNFHPNFMAWKASRDMDRQADVNGCRKSMPRKAT